ncbi:MAG: transcription initiation protein [Bacteroidota bacterium]
MHTYLLIFRADYTAIARVPQAEMQLRIEKWLDWVDFIARQSRLEEGGNHLAPDGRVITKEAGVTNGPYAANNESVLGYILVKATGYDEAAELAKSCPILAGDNTSVEVRKTGSL